MALRRKAQVDDQLLYPADDGIPMEDGRHYNYASLLKLTLDAHLKALGRDAWVAANNFIYYKRGDPKACVGPDFHVILDAKFDPERDCWRVWNEDLSLMPPQAVVELVSKSSNHKDRVKNFAIYRDVLKVPSYFIYDNRRKRFDAYALVGNEYVALQANERGHYRCDSLGLLIGFHEEMLRWFKPDGTMLPTDGERLAATNDRLAAVEADVERLKRLLEERGIDS